MASKSTFAVSEPRPHQDAIPQFCHFAQFYTDEASLTERVSQYLVDGLNAGESVLLIAAEQHCKSLEHSLRGHDLDLYRDKGRCVAVDAGQVLSCLTEGGRLEGPRFEKAVGELIEESLKASTSSRLRVFVEMGACLRQSGRHNSAIQVEEFWNGLIKRWSGPRGLSLCCAYPLSAFRDPGQTDVFLRICALHSRVFPAGGYGEDDGPDALLSAVAKLQQIAFSYQDLAGRFLQEQEQERSRLGRWLHDGVAQKMALLSIRLDRLRESATAEPAGDEALDHQWNRVRELVDQINEDIHRLSHSLHSAVLEQLGLLPGLRSLIAEFSEEHGILVHLEADAVPGRLPPELVLCLYRVVQESLRNVARHSGAASARVTVNCREGEIRLAIEDSGRGFDPSRAGSYSGLGLVGMREKLRAAGGTLQIHSSPLGGARVEARVPYRILEPA